ncbi:MAG: hypothetical protein ACRD1H_04720, partial [Vicinamibacterales bacterium]
AYALRLLPGVDLTESLPWDLQELLGQKGISVEAAHQLMGAIALEAVQTRPAEFFWFSFGLAWRDLFADPGDLIHWFARSPVPQPDLETPRPFRTSASGIRFRAFLDWVFAILWRPLCWMAVAGALCSVLARERTVALALSWIPIGYLVACGFVQYFLPRYNVAVTPFVTAVAMIPLGVIAGWLGWNERVASRRAAGLHAAPPDD